MNVEINPSRKMDGTKNSGRRENMECRGKKNVKVYYMLIRKELY